MGTNNNEGTYNYHFNVECIDMRGNKSVDCLCGDVRDNNDAHVVDSQYSVDCDFVKVVVKKLTKIPTSTIDYKAVNSFCSAVDGVPCESLEEQLRIWIATMLEKGISPSSRKRYFGKLHALYNTAAAQKGEDTFDSLSQLAAAPLNSAFRIAVANSVLLTKTMDALLLAAESKPALALFCFMLFNATGDIDKAINLDVDSYTPDFRQLDRVIEVSTLHPRRRYVFALQQSQKRMTQLRKEALLMCESYLTEHGLRFIPKFSREDIVSLWIAKARSLGLSMPEIRAIASPLPYAFEYMSIVAPAKLSEYRRTEILRMVADAFSSASERWYAIKLHRRVTFDAVRDTLARNLNNSSTGIDYFYPVKEMVRREGKKKIRYQEPYIQDIVFFRTKSTLVATVDSIIRSERKGWVFRLTASRTSDYSIIPPSGMFLFQRAVGQLQRDAQVGISTSAPCAIGRKVRITGGIMEGYEGIIYDIKKSDDTEAGNRIFSIRLTSARYLNIHADIDEAYITPIDNGSAA